jgi:hypothetical protein
MISLITFIKVLIKNQIHWLIQFGVAKVKIQIKFRKQVNNSQIGNFKLSFMGDLSSKCKQELLVQVSPILESSNQTQSNFIQFNT